MAAGAQPTNTAAPPSAPAGKPYVLAANDVILVEVYQEEDLRSNRRIGQDGTVNLPLIESVVLGGKTIDQATALIRDELAKDFLVNPRVTITVMEQAKRKFTVMGHVAKTGPYEFTGGETITLIQAIAMAGGPTTKGKLSKVTVARPVGNQFQIFEMDAESSARDPKARGFEIQPNDVITVPEKIF